MKDPRSARRGYTLVALMIGITVMMILIAAVLPVASTEMQREREEELIFRGRQYAEGIRVFRKRYGRYPNTLAEMYEVRPRTLRKLWKDPIRNTDQWGLVSLTNPPLLHGPGATGGTGPGAGTGPGGGSRFGPGGDSSGSGTSTPGRGTTGSGFGGGKPAGGSGDPQPTPVPTHEVDPFPTPSFGGPARSGSPDQGAPPGPVMGVYSLSSKKALRLYEGREIYSDWKFTEQTLTQPVGPDLGGPAVPGPGGGITPPGGSFPGGSQPGGVKP